jgi:early secretory antigenic target protein ESAT-6
MSTLKVTSSQLITLSQSLDRGSASVSEQLDGMRRAIEPLASDWEGAASGSFQKLWDEWQNGARQVREALDGISKQLKSAGEAYARTEDDVKRSMG